MSVRTRDHLNSLNSTISDGSELPFRYRKFPNIHEQSQQNDFHQNQNQDIRKHHATSYFGQANEQPSVQVNRQYSFAPYQVKEESETNLSRSFERPPPIPRPPIPVEQIYKQNYSPPQNQQQNLYPVAQPPFATYEAYGYFNQEPNISRYISAQKSQPSNKQGQSFAQDSQAVATLFTGETLSKEVIFLLAEEEEHIKRYRIRVEKEKSRIAKDTDLLKDEIINLLDNLKVQFQQQIDDHYKRYINVYAAFKEEIIKLKQQKLEAPLHLKQQPLKQDLSNASNKNLIRELEEIQYRTQMAKLNQYLDDLNKNRMLTITEISKDLLQLTASQNQLYNSEITVKQYNQIKQEIQASLLSKFSNSESFVQPLDHMIKLPPASRVNLSNRDQSLQNFEIEQRKSFNQSFQQFKPISSIPVSQRPNQQSELQQKMPSQSFFDQQVQEDQSKSFTNQQNKFPQQFQNFSNIPNQQQQSRIQLPQFQNPIIPARPNPQYDQHADPTHGGQLLGEQLTLSEKSTPLCMVVLRDNLLATGGRDGYIRIWEGTQHQTELQACRGGVCCLQVIYQQGVPVYLVAGSDSDDGFLTLWNLQTFKKIGVLNGHTAAVVSLIYVDDGQSFISASYDKSVCIWNSESDNNVPFQKLSTAHTNAVTALALAPGKQRFVSGGLDCVINIWKIKYKSDGKFESTYLEKSIKNGSIVCSLNAVALHMDVKIISGSKDGKLRLWDIISGDLECEVQACVGPIVEMIMLASKESCMALIMSSKDKNLMLTNLGTGESQVVDVQERINIEFGVGVFPKMQINKKNLYIISQNDLKQEVIQYNMIWE